MPPTKNTKNANKKTKGPSKKVVKTPPPQETPVVQETPPPQETPVVQETPVTPPVQTEEVVSDTPYLEEFSSLLTELDTALNNVRSLKSRLQKLEKQVHRDHKVMAKKLKGRPRKVRDPNAPKSGFARPGPVSDEMRKFLSLSKDEQISRTDVTKRIHQYCKDKNLQNPSDKRHIKADASLRKLLNMSTDDELTFFNLQKYMKVHFPNKEGVFPSV